MPIPSVCLKEGSDIALVQLHGYFDGRVALLVLNRSVRIVLIKQLYNVEIASHYSKVHGCITLRVFVVHICPMSQQELNVVNTIRHYCEAEWT